MWKILTDIGSMEADEVHRLLLHADAYAFGLLTSEILTGCFPVNVYKGGDVRELTDANVGLGCGVERSGNA